MRILTAATTVLVIALVIGGIRMGPNAVPEAPDIATVEADLIVPRMSFEEPAPGRRVKQVLPEYEDTGIYHTLYLPPDWQPDQTIPVLIEFAGNGPTRSNHGDICTGRVEDCSFGFGLSKGQRFIWVCMPYLNDAGTDNVTRWWGDPPNHDPQPTVDYCRKTIPWICDNFGGDPNNVVLCGFSRGAIACNFIGLHNDNIAKLWKAFVPYSHYDGVVTRWGYPGDDRDSALQRLRRLDGRPQYIIHEDSDNRSTNLAATKDYLRSSNVDAPFRFETTGFRNHNDKWILRPSPARDSLREWLDQIVAGD
jgi:hypothetical protein